MIVAALGPALTALPINVLRVVVGGLLLVFGLQWLRKAVLRYAGLKALRDEDEDSPRRPTPREPLRAPAAGFDPYSFTIAFKGVLLEGLEVVFIVLTFGASQHDIGLAAAAAAVAVGLVVLAGGSGTRATRTRTREHDEVLRRRDAQLVRDLLGRRGAGASWPGGDAALLAIIPGVRSPRSGWFSGCEPGAAPARGRAT